MEANKMENVIKIALVVVTAAAAAFGVQLNPAAKPADVAQIVRDEVAPLRVQVADLARIQGDQGARLARVESATLGAPFGVALPSAATPGVR